jgi:hypothetical protein
MGISLSKRPSLEVLLIGSMMVCVLTGCSTKSALNLSMSSPSSLTVVWMVDLCSPRLEECVRFVGIDANVWGTPDDVEEDVWAAPAVRCIVLVLGVISAVIGVCVTIGNGGNLVSLSSLLLIGIDKVLPEGTFICVLLVSMVAAVPATPLRDGLVMVATVALFCVMDVDTVRPIVLVLGESKAIVFAKVEGGVSNDPSAIIAAIAGTGVDIVFSLQICLRLSAPLSVRCAYL